MMQKLKKHSALFGLIFTVSAALITFVMTWWAYLDAQVYARMQEALFDCGVDVIGAMISQ